MPNTVFVFSIRFLSEKFGSNIIFQQFISTELDGFKYCYLLFELC